MKDFSKALSDPDFCMNGPCLVEASAGTGKTYSIQNAYLRLLLEKQLTVEQILVVTFTEAATHELRERLRSIICMARDVLSGQVPANVQDLERVQSLMAAAGVKEGDENALRTLRLAAMDFDRASVFTIHAFCQRVLARNAFECGQDLNAELLTSDSEILSEICQDWWRRVHYGKAADASVNPFIKLDDVRSLLQEAWKRRDGRLRPDFEDTRDTGKLTDLAKAFGEVLQRAQDVLTAEDGFSRKLNAGGTSLLDQRLPEILSQLEQGRIAAAELEACFKVVNKEDRNAPKLTEQRIEHPKEVQSFLDAVSTLKKELGNKKNPSWKNGHLDNGGRSFEVSGLDGFSRVTLAKLDGHLEQFKSAKKPEAFKRIVILLNKGLPNEGCGLEFFSDLKELVGVSAKELFSSSQRNFDEVFPDIVDLLKSLNQCEEATKGRIIDGLREKLEEEIRSRAMLTYEDLLRGVQNALRGPGGMALKKILRDEYHAVMIDEFQDTDEVQYEIFREVFHEQTCPMLCVGDPKQAIYGFRGGDVFTYYKARLAVPEARRFSLSTNYRSEDGLIHGINDLFKEEEEAAVFLNPNIEYRGNLKVKGVEPEKQMSPNEIPLQILQFASVEKGKPGIGSPIYHEVMDEACNEVIRLLEEETIAGEPVKPGQICFLVHAHSDASHICKALRRIGVPVVQQHSGNVFDSEEAKALGLLLRVLIEPADGKAVRAVLASGLLPCTSNQLRRMVAGEDEEMDEYEYMGPGPKTLVDWICFFKEAAERWEKSSLAEALEWLDQGCGLRAWLAGSPDGERRLTNLFHLTGLVHEVSTQRLGSASSLLDWYSRQLDPDQREENDAFELRLSTQKDAVKVMTVFKSKGLEFPIVFAPFLWRRHAQARSRHQKLAVCHDDNQELQLYIDKQDREANARAKSEKLQEDVRLLYVALTRAVHRAYLYDVRTSVDLSASYAVDHLIRQWQGRPESTRSSSIKFEIHSGRKNPKKSMPIQTNPVTILPELEQQEVDSSQRSTSFSGLEPNATDMRSDESRDWDGADTDSDAGHESESAIFEIAGGKRTGNCWHEIFEHLDFKSGETERTALVKEKLDIYGICRSRLPETALKQEQAVQNMVQRTLSLSLPTIGGPAFCLGEVSQQNRRSELEFCFSLHRGADSLRTPMILKVLEEHWGNDAVRKPFLDALVSWDREIPQGYLTGFIDLVFYHEGRFYIVDWKSNRRSGKIKDFDQKGLMDEMARHSYFLQYLLYTVALDAHLSQTLKDYDYGTHFGGVFYLFLRGFEHQETKGCFSDRPTVELVRSLGRLLCAGEGSE